MDTFWCTHACLDCLRANVLKGEPREFCLPDFEDLFMTLVKVPYVERCFFACLLPRTSLAVIFFLLGGGMGGEGLQTREV